MINRLLYKLSAELPCRLIHLSSGPYLERYFVGQWFGVTVYLHRFVSSDKERHLHNHPWTWGRAFVLAGGYDEEVVTDLCPRMPFGCVTEYRRINWYNRVDGATFHRIDRPDPGTWTLFVHGPRQYIKGVRKGWGFLERVAGRVVFEEHPASNPRWWKSARKGKNTEREPL